MMTSFLTDDAAIDALRYPIGRFDPSAPVGAEALADAIEHIRTTPGIVRRAVQHLTDDDLELQYRPDGWTVRQIVHHLADAATQGYTRTRLALTETEPLIRSYDQTRWAALFDARTNPIGPSLAILEGLHGRWTSLLRSLEPPDFDRLFVHPFWGFRSVRTQTAYAGWHVRHHAAHITLALRRDPSAWLVDLSRAPLLRHA